MKRLLIAFLLCTPAYAGKPMVECANGKCVISEADWKQFQEFHKAARAQMENMAEGMEAQNKQMYGLMGALAACRSRQPEKEA